MKRLERKNWLIPFLREAIERYPWFEGKQMAKASHGFAEEVRLEKWLEASLRRRGFFGGTPKVVWPAGDGPINSKDRGRWFFLNTLEHQVQLLLELHLVLGIDFDPVSGPLHLMEIFAHQVGKADLAESFWDCGTESWEGDKGKEALTKAMAVPSRKLGQELKNRYLQRWDHPLLGLPIHQILVFADIQELIDIAALVLRTQGRCDRSVIRERRAQAHLLRLELIDAVIAMAASDGVITAEEKRLVVMVAELGRVEERELKLLWSGSDEPLDPNKLAEAFSNPRLRRFLFEQLALQSHFDGVVDEHELTLLDTIAKAFEIEGEIRVSLELEALEQLEDNPDLVSAFRLGGMLQRYRNHINSKIESILVRNLEKIITEIKETGELAQLLARRTQGKLTPEEDARVKAQIIDICKTVPALAVFAVPGGSVILPILLKLLPFDLMPTAFSEPDESL